MPQEQSGSGWSTPVASLSAQTGNAQTAAPTLEQGIAMNVLAMERTITELKNVLEYRKTNALMPYHSETWHHLLIKHNLLDKYPSLPSSFKLRFDAGIPQYMLPTHLITAHLSSYIHNNTRKLWTENSNLEGTSDHSPETKFRISLAPFNCHPCPLFPKLVNLINTVLYIISPSHIRLKAPSHLLTILSTPTYFCAHGEPSQPFAHLSGTSHQAPKPQFMMWQKCTKLFPWPLTSGLASSSSYKTQIIL